MYLKRAVKNRQSLSMPRLLTFVGLCLVAIILTLAAVILIFRGAILNSYVKGKVERAFAKAHPGSVLSLGKLHYAVGDNRLEAQSATLSATNSTLKVNRISLSGVRWVRLLWGKTVLEEVLARASLEATNLDMDFPKSHHGIHCLRLACSVLDSELIAEDLELRSLVPDEELFAADPFRTTRFHVLVPECKVAGLEYGELLQGKSYRARSVHLSQPSFEALVNRDKPVGPLMKSPLMVQEALAAIPRSLQIDSLSITNGHIKYCERVVAGAAPGVLTFTAIYVSAEGIANRKETSTALKLKAQGNLMNAGVLKEIGRAHV
jgi:hypothetical protein